MSHTPGEWTIKEGSYHTAEIWGGEDKGGYRKNIATVYNAGPNERGNAQLIASAPELYEACKIAEEAVRTAIPQEAVQLIHEQGDFDALCIARIRLEEAIAKAEGNE